MGGELSAPQETLLAILGQESSPWVQLPRLARIGDMEEQVCLEAVRGLFKRGLVSVKEPGLGPLPTRGAAALTDTGRQEARDLGVVAPEGPVAEFSQGLDGVQQAVLDVVTEQQLRVISMQSKLSQIRTTVRQRLAAADTETTTNALEELVRSEHLQRSGGPEPSFYVTFRGLLASAWGSNSLRVIGVVLDLLRVSHEANPSQSRYSWRSLRTTGQLPHRAFNLVYLCIASSKLGTGVSHDRDELWWSFPPEPDILGHKPVLEHVRDCLRPVEVPGAPATVSTQPSPAVVSMNAGEPRSGQSDPLHADPEVAAELDRLNPDFAACYRQALRDLSDRGRESFVGVVAEMREVLAAVLHELGPDDEVEAQPWYKKEPSTNGPTRAQRVKYIMATRSSSKSRVASEAITELEQRLPQLARELYSRASRGTHLAPTDRGELMTLFGYWQSLLRDLLLK